MEHITYETTEEFGPFCECQVVIACRYWPETVDSDGELEKIARVEIDCASFYSNGRWIAMDKEESSNIGSGLEDEIIEAQQRNEQSVEQDLRHSGGYEG